VVRAEGWASLRRRLLREHRAILKAVLAGEGTNAARLMSRHIARFYDERIGRPKTGGPAQVRK
jgi:DNA-binding GntR family transcriptional regulator